LRSKRVKERPLDVAIADFISYAFNPYFFSILLPIISITKERDPLYGILALMFVALPPLLRHIIGVITGNYNWNIDDHQKRAPVLILSGIGGLLGFWLLHSMGAHYVSIATLSYALTSITAAICSKVVKVSIHMATASSSTAIIYWAFGEMPGILATLLTILIAWSRIKLGAHNFKEILEGYAVAGVGTTTAFLVATVAL